MRVIVIGAGAAGLVAAAEAASRAADVTLLEKNNKTGVKILMSGGTRCNLTHDTDARGITVQFGQAARFLQPSVGAFPPDAVVRMFSKWDLPTKVESTGKIFPQSDRALDVRNALQRQAIESGVKIRMNSTVTGLRQDQHGWQVDLTKESLRADRVIVTAGGKSWPRCGTTGDAYPWLRQIGHTVVPPRPALVPLVGGYPWTHAISGVTVNDCVASVSPLTPLPGKKQRTLARRRASWLFTHFGFSGPAAMDVSGAITAADSPSAVRLSIDLLPELPDSKLREIFADLRSDGGRRRVSAVLGEWLPKRLAEALVPSAIAPKSHRHSQFGEQRDGSRSQFGERADGDELTVAQLSRSLLQKLVQNVKRLELPITGTRGFAKAEVTAGGVSLKEIDPKTMASRIADNLYIAGEVLDVDGPIGGYNFQAAFATGRAAGIAAGTQAC